MKMKDLATTSSDTVHCDHTVTSTSSTTEIKVNGSLERVPLESSVQHEAVEKLNNGCHTPFLSPSPSDIDNTTVISNNQTEILEPKSNTKLELTNSLLNGNITHVEEHEIDRVESVKEEATVKREKSPDSTKEEPSSTFSDPEEVTSTPQKSASNEPCEIEVPKLETEDLIHADVKTEPTPLKDETKVSHVEFATKVDSDVKPVPEVKHASENKHKRVHDDSRDERKSGDSGIPSKKERHDSSSEHRKKSSHHHSSSSSSRSRHSSHHSSSSHHRSRPPPTPYCATCIKERMNIAGLTIQCHRPGCSHTVGVECSGFKSTQSLSTAPCAHSGVEYLKYGHLMRCEVYPNGGATVIHMEQEQIEHLSKREMDELVDEYFRVSLKFERH